MNSSGDDCNSCRSCWTVFSAIVACLIFAALVWVTKQYTLPASPVDEARKAERANALRDLRAAEADALAHPGWIDQNKGIVRLPIDDALRMDLQLWQDPAAARANLIAREEKASAVPPPAPAKPSAFE